MKNVRKILTIVIASMIVIDINNIIRIGTYYSNPILLFIHNYDLFLQLIISSIILFLIIYFWYGKDYKCPSCNKRFCLKKIGEEVIDIQDVNFKVEVARKNIYNKVIGYQEQYIPGKRITYRIKYICRKCDEKCYREHTRKIPNT